MDSRQTQILLALELAEIIKKADGAKYNAQCQYIKNGGIFHKGKIAQQTKCSAQNEHESAHHGGTGLVAVPDRAHLTDGLASFQRPQNGHQQ